MFKQLSHDQQQDVMRIVNALDDQDLRPLIIALAGDSNLTEPHPLVRDTVAHIVFNNDETAGVDEMEDTLPCVAEALSFIIEIMADHIKQGDMLPIECASDIYILVSTSHNANYYWQDLIKKKNLNLMTNSMPDGENVSAAIFKAVVNTAFDFVMNN